jgi:hypothetical protein
MATVKKVKKAQFGAPIRKGGYRGGCAATTSSADRAERREGRQAERDYNKLMRQNKRDERKAERAAKKEAPAAKYGKSVVKKAQDGKALRNTKEHEKNRKQSTALTEMGKKTTRAAIDKRTDEMAKSLDKASVFGKNYIAPGDSAKKMVNVLAKQARKGSNARPMGANLDKKSFDKVPSLDKLKKKNAPKKEMKYGGKAKKMMSGGKCKYGC